MATRTRKGTPSKRHQAITHQHMTGKPKQPDASSPNTSAPNNAALAAAAQDAALNPPFDPRMRRVGSPLNLTSQIKRGWIQTEDGTQRVNFLFNPAAIDISATVNSDTKQDLQAPDSEDILDPDYVSTGSSTGVSLLYDRTYELFSVSPGYLSPDGRPTTNPANYFGVYADLAAWYYLLKMLPEIPTTWQHTIFTQPMHQLPMYLFVGPNLYFYGFVNALSATITHWSQDMVPMRAKLDVGFTILPKPLGSTVDSPAETQSATEEGGWAYQPGFDTPETTP
jgi:hypothetical protein